MFGFKHLSNARDTKLFIKNFKATDVISGYWLGCTDTVMGTSTIRQHEQFLKNYNMIRQIGYHYNRGM